MSLAPLRCCDVESVSPRTRPFPPDQSTTYMVWWRCPKCGRVSGDLGSLQMPDEAARQALGTLPADLVGAAHEAFECGLVRRSLTLLDLAAGAPETAPAAFAEKGRQLFHCSFAAQSAAALEKAISLGDTAPTTRGYLALALSDTPRRAEAVPMLRTAVAGEPGAGIWWHGLIRLLVRLEKYDEAEADLARAGVLALEDSWRAGIATEQANVFCARRRPADALTAADEALRLAPSNTYSHYVRGRALGMLGRLDEAVAEMDRILSMAPGDPDATRAKSAFAAAAARRR